MAVHGINSTDKGKTQETGDWSVRRNGKIVKDVKGKDLAGLSYQAARSGARAHTSRTGEFTAPVRG